MESPPHDSESDSETESTPIDEDFSENEGKQITFLRESGNATRYADRPPRPPRFRPILSQTLSSQTLNVEEPRRAHFGNKDVYPGKKNAINRAGVHDLPRTTSDGPRRRNPPPSESRTWAAVMEEESREDKPLLPSFREYQIGGLLGKGSFGKVFKGLNLSSGQFVAIKEIPLQDSAVVANELPRILKEIQLLKQLHHTNIVQYIDCHMMENTCLHIVLEFIENGSLKDIIKKFGSLPEPLTARYSFQVLQGLAYLHSLDILHRDIKGANILITKDGICKLADFGVATKLHTASEFDEAAAGTTYWMAPEIFEMQEPTAAADVWSFGCTVIELLTGSPPYRKLPKAVAICKILENESPPLPPKISPALEEFLSLCFRKDPAERASIKELLSHPWVTSNNPKHRRPHANNEVYRGMADILRFYDVELDYTAPNAGITEEQMDMLIKAHSQAILQKIALKKKQESPINPYGMDEDDLRMKLAEMQVENDILLQASQFIQESMTRQLMNVTGHLQQSTTDLEEAEMRKRSITKKIVALEESFLSVQSDMQLAQVIYGDRLPMSHFTNGIRGVLLIKRSKAVNAPPQPGRHQTNKDKWKKRWILLQDNFLFFYKANEEAIDPVLVIRLHNIKIDLVSERDIGKKFCFLLTVPNRKSYYLAAANPQVLMKWINVLSSTTSWHYSEDSALYDADRAALMPQFAAGNSSVKKSESLDELTRSKYQSGSRTPNSTSTSYRSRKPSRLGEGIITKAASLTHKSEDRTS